MTGPRGPAAVLSEPQIRALLSTFGRRAPTAIRNRALVLLAWRTGLRADELLRLELRDLELDGRSPTLFVRRGKGGKQRTVGIHQEAQQALERWLEVRRREGLAHHRTVFCTLAGKPLHDTYVRTMIARHGRRAGLERVHPHAFRATLAVELHQEGKPLAAIRDVLGHSNIATTDAYLKRVFPQAAIDAVIDRRLKAFTGQLADETRAAREA